MNKKLLMTIAISIGIFAVAFGLGYYSGDYHANKENIMQRSEFNGTFEFMMKQADGSRKDTYLSISYDKQKYFIFYVGNEKVIASGPCRIEQNNVILYNDEDSIVATVAYFDKQLWIIGDSMGRVELTKTAAGPVIPRGHKL